MIVFFLWFLFLLHNRVEKPPIIFIVFKSLRADHLPCYGYTRNTTPNVCKIANDGVLFENAYSQGNHITTSLPSLLTSLLPSSVGVDAYDPVHPFQKECLSYSFYSLPEALKDYGYTLVFQELPDFLLPFNQYEIGKVIKDADPELITRELKNESVFILISPSRPNQMPFMPSKNFRYIWENISDETLNLLEDKILKRCEVCGIQLDNQSLQNQIDLYDEEISEADNLVGKIVEKLKEMKIYDRSFIIVTSVRGWLFGEHEGYIGYGHGPPYKEVIHVPLIIKFPNNLYSGKRISQNVRLIDIAPTVYEFLGIKVSNIEGKSLLPIINGKNESWEVFAAAFPKRKVSVLIEKYQFIYHPDILELCEKNEMKEYEIFDLRKNEKINNFSLALQLSKLMCEKYIDGFRKRKMIENCYYWNERVS
jgi:membrane-anchored protein YejM (alkaline phosphatase superfamily)